jgi:hypothetical protein
MKKLLFSAFLVGAIMGDYAGPDCHGMESCRSGNGRNKRGGGSTVKRSNPFLQFAYTAVVIGWATVGMYARARLPVR